MTRDACVPTRRYGRPEPRGAGELRRARLFLASLIVLALGPVSHNAAWASDDVSETRERPAIRSDRWREDWSLLADQRVPSQPFDSLKYIPLLPGDPDSYVSLGMTVRQTFESSDAPAFGTSSFNPKDDYRLQRTQFHIDVRLDRNWQLFAQAEDVRAFDKTFAGPADANQLDLRLAFVGYSRPSDTGTFRARIGRQDFEFDLQRFLSSRDGPNVRQSFDAVWVAWETDQWRLHGLMSQPVEYKNDKPFDDRSTRGTRFSGLRIERRLAESMELTGYYALYQREKATYLAASGEENRHVFDMRFAGIHAGLDWDIEAMAQVGNVGEIDVRAWAFGARAGYTSDEAPWSPRMGLQFDVASGDQDAGDGVVETFNPLFPNGYYFSLGSHTGYTNLIHLKPSLTVKPTDAFTVTAGVGLVWRQTTQDAVYTMPSIPIRGTAGTGNPWTGGYAQLRADYVFSPNLKGAVEFVRFDVGSTLTAAGGHDSRYFQAELKFAW